MFKRFRCWLRWYLGNMHGIGGPRDSVRLEVPPPKVQAHPPSIPPPPQLQAHGVTPAQLLSYSLISRTNLIVLQSE